MGLTLRQITYRTGGGEIARSTALIGTEFIIGRGTDCDIQVPDLAIMLRHARLVQLASGRIAIDEIGGVPLRVDGRFVAHVEVDVRSGATLALGGHALTIAGGDGPNEVVVTVERVASAYDAAASKDAGGVFSLASVMPGKRALAWSLIVIVLGIGLAWPLWAHFQPAPPPSPPAAAASPPVLPAAFRADQIWTSGPLSRVHADLAGNCGACHDEGFVSVRDDSCRACHAKLPDHAPLATMQAAQVAPKGLAAETTATLQAAAHLTVGRCASCHKEHEGPDGALMVPASFCGDCHKGLKSRLPETMLLNAVDFATPGGHPQFRPTIVTQPALRPAVARVSLDERPRENSGLKFPHRLHVEAGGSAVRMARAMGSDVTCAACHVPDAGGIRFKPVEMERNCSACHDLAFDRDRSGTVRSLPHGKPAEVVATLRAFYAAQPGFAGFRDRRRPGLVPDITAARGVDAKVRAVFSRGGACFDCHAVIPPVRGLDFRIAPVSVSDHYLPKGRFPHRRHSATPCATCHTAASSDSSADVLLPGIATCRSCHGNPAAKPAAPATCETCHGYHQEEGGSPARRPFVQKGQNLSLFGPGSHGTPRSSEAITGKSVNTGS